jgi:1-acyl-sn-glycerol-3-phosphate acyltransferase
MKSPRESYELRFTRLTKGGGSVESMDNSTKRVLFSELELLKMDVEADNSYHSLDEGQDLVENITAFTSKLVLDFSKRERRWWTGIDEIMRFVGVWLTFATFGFFFSLPLIVLGAIDHRMSSLGIIKRHMEIAPFLQRWMAQVVLLISGVHLTAQGMNADKFLVDKGQIVVFFSHASSLDAFIICATCPIRYRVLAKKELFLIPYFGWLLVAFGGVPIDRKNRADAVQSLNTTAKMSRDGDCILVSPEGTRSTTGQLMSFKKGPLYLWESLEARVNPIVIFGAFDLYPPGKIMNSTGRIYVRCMDSIENHEARSRDAMSHLVRRRMLESMMDCPKDVGGDIGWMQRMMCLGALTAVVLFNMAVFSELWHIFFVVGQLTFWAVVGIILVFTLIITLLLYMYAIYISPALVNINQCCTSFDSGVRDRGDPDQDEESQLMLADIASPRSP